MQKYHLVKESMKKVIRINNILSVLVILITLLASILAIDLSTGLAECNNSSTIPGSVEYSNTLRWATMPDELAANQCANLAINGTQPPFQWSWEGTGVSMTEISDTEYQICDTGAACGTVKVTVKDSRGLEIKDYIRTGRGEWRTIGHDCLLPGPATQYLYYGYYGYHYERVVGKFRQRQAYNSGSYFYGTCLYHEPPCGNQPYSADCGDSGYDQCITLESTGLVDDYDRNDFPCMWQSPDPDPYCTAKGSPGWTSMKCWGSGVLNYDEWRCEQ